MAANGQLPASELAPIAGGRLRRDCAAGWNAMNVEARRQGIELRPTGSLSSYRDLAGQQYLWDLYQKGQGALAARPGTSNHGWGTAVDVATQQMRSMVDRIGARFGWSKVWSDAPSEWWHIVYQSGHYSGPDPGPTGGGAPAPPPPEQPADENMIASEVSAAGQLHVWVATEDAVFYTWQRGATTDWNAAGGGLPAGLILFCRSIDNRKIAGIAAKVARNGVLHLFVRFRDGTTAATWQQANQSAWSGGRAGVSPAGLSYLAAKP